MDRQPRVTAGASANFALISGSILLRRAHTIGAGGGGDGGDGGDSCGIYLDSDSATPPALLTNTFLAGQAGIGGEGGIGGMPASPDGPNGENARTGEDGESRDVISLP